MTDTPIRAKHLIMERCLKDSDLGRALGRRIGRHRIVERLGPGEYHTLGKGDLLLAQHQGAFVKPCPGTPEYICCGLQIIHLGLGCRLDCSYCILQEYLDTEALVVFGNMDEALARVKDRLAMQDGPRRFCTGEFTDSLLLEHWTGLGARLVDFFKDRAGYLLELKTKTTHIDGLLDLDHGGRTILSFSVNAPQVAKLEENKAAPPAVRIKAAARAVQAGYRVGFHFDPLILHPGWQAGYRETINRIFDRIPGDRIAWISMGGFRYLPRMKSIVRRRHPESRIMDEEFILAADGKMRYLRPIRVEMYGEVLEAIRSAHKDACVYMCMESPRVWKDVFGYDPGPNGLIDMLDQRV